MALTLLSTILARMNRWTTADKVEEQFKIRDLDDAIREQRRSLPLPWTLQKGSLRVFSDVLEYPAASDHDELAFFDNKEKSFGKKPRFRYTSLNEFYEDIDNRNDLAEIWDGNTRYLAVRYQKFQRLNNQLIDNGETVGNWTASGTASAVTADAVVFKEGNGSIRFTVTAGTAVMTGSFTAISNTNYQRNYYFIWIYLDAVPTSVTLRFGNDASNFIESAALTTQFSGQAMKADQWNLFAFDLNVGTVTGTITNTAFDYHRVSMAGAVAGTYYIDASYLREWEELDYWYYSTRMVATVGNTTANQDFFFNSSDIYSTDSQLIGDSEWVDLAMYTALLNVYADKENTLVYHHILKKYTEAFTQLLKNYPSLKPLMIQKKWRFDYDVENAWYRDFSTSA